MSARPGGTPVALTSTTGSPCRRKAAARPADRWMTSSRGCTAGTAMIPFCKSITTRAGLASRVVRAILLLFGDVICGAGHSVSADGPAGDGPAADGPAGDGPAGGGPAGGG